MSHPSSLHPTEQRNTRARVRLSASLSRAILPPNHTHNRLEASITTLKPRFLSPRQPLATLKIPKTCFMHKSHRES